MFEEGITVFLVHGFDRQLLTVDHGTDTIVAALHLEHGKMVNLLTVLCFHLIELIQWTEYQHPTHSDQADGGDNE